MGKSINFVKFSCKSFFGAGLSRSCGRMGANSQILLETASRDAHRDAQERSAREQNQHRADADREGQVERPGKDGQRYDGSACLVVEVAGLPTRAEPPQITANQAIDQAGERSQGEQRYGQGKDYQAHAENQDGEQGSQGVVLDGRHALRRDVAHIQLAPGACISHIFHALDPAEHSGFYHQPVVGLGDQPGGGTAGLLDDGTVQEPLRQPAQLCHQHVLAMPPPGLGPEEIEADPVNYDRSKQRSEHDAEEVERESDNFAEQRLLLFLLVLRSFGNVICCQGLSLTLLRRLRHDGSRPPGRQGERI